VNTLFDALGFLGAWLLVIGPSRQAVIELEAEDVDRAAVTSRKTRVARPDPINGWWWLLPPIAIVKQRRLSADYRARVMAEVPDGVADQFGDFVDKATAWILVAAGALLIATKETWDLTESAGFAAPVFWILFGAPLLLTLGLTVARARTPR
jgi:hypothetical protein